MALIADTGAIYALYDARDRHHRAVSRLVAEESETIVVPKAILAEIDYLLRVRLGNRAVMRFLEGVRIGGYSLEPFTAADVTRSLCLLETYSALNLGLADVTVIATADRLGSRR